MAIGDPAATYEFIDRFCLRDVDGVPVAPATSLAGLLAGLARASLRARQIRPADSVAYRALFGEASGKDGGGQEARLTVRDARPYASARTTSTVRDRNSVDRKRGAAADKQVFKEEALYVDGFELEVEFWETGPRTPAEESVVDEEARDPDRGAWRLLIDAIDLMKHGWANLGGQFGVGAGRVCLEDVKVRTWDRGDSDKLLDFATRRWDGFDATEFDRALEEAAESCLEDAATDRSDCPPERLRLTCRLRPTEPLLVKAGFTNEEPREAQFRRDAPEVLNGEQPAEMSFPVDAGFPVDPFGGPFVPGSSIRGPIRTRVERASRTVACEGRKAWGLDEMRGRANDLRGRQDWDEAEAVPCLVTQVFGFEQLGGRIGFTDAFPIFPADFENRRKLIDHVAIDRFTGGAADQRKFNERPYIPRLDSVLEPDEKGDLLCEIEIFDFEERHLGLLLLLLRDLALGRVKFGANKNDGMGRMVLVGAEAKVLTAPGGLLWHGGAANGTVAGFSEFTTTLDWPRPTCYGADDKNLWTERFRRAEDECRDYFVRPVPALRAKPGS